MTLFYESYPNTSNHCVFIKHSMATFSTLLYTYYPSGQRLQGSTKTTSADTQVFCPGCSSSELLLFFFFFSESDSHRLLLVPGELKRVCFDSSGSNCLSSILLILNKMRSNLLIHAYSAQTQCEASRINCKLGEHECECKTNNPLLFSLGRHWCWHQMWEDEQPGGARDRRKTICQYTFSQSRLEIRRTEQRCGRSCCGITS